MFERILARAGLFTIGIVFFFTMMMKGWGLSVQSWKWIVAYYLWHFASIVISVALDLRATKKSS